MLDCSQVLDGDRSDGIEEFPAFLAQEGSGRSALQQRAQVVFGGNDEDSVEVSNALPLYAVELPQDGAEQGPGIAAPVSILSFVVGDQRPSELIGVVRLNDLGKQIPTGGTRVERVQDDVVALRIAETLEIAAIGVGNDRPIAAGERARQELLDRCALTGAGPADYFEVLGFVDHGNRMPPTVRVRVSLGPGPISSVSTVPRSTELAELRCTRTTPANALEQRTKMNRNRVLGLQTASDRRHPQTPQ